jgi:hypothetical protein
MAYVTRCILILLLLLPTGLPAAQAEWKNVERVVALGDVHGDFNAFVTLLRAAGVIDQHDHWIGGKTHLVQTGDVPDRGADTRKVMDLLMELERESAKAGGHVHALIGNHEAMNVYGDLRYATPGEFAAFANERSEALRATYWKKEDKKTPRPTFDDKRKWETEHPLGWFEQRMAFQPDGAYGKWIRSHNAVVKINDTIYLHGGISARYATMPLKQLNDAISGELSDITSIKPDDPVRADDGPLWYRGMATENGPAAAALVDQVLAAQGAKRIVIGHTPTAGAVIPRFDGKVLMIDVGMSTTYGNHRACLIIEGDSAYAMHRGEKLDLPTGGGLLPYLKKALALEPPDSMLAKYVAAIDK